MLNLKNIIRPNILNLSPYSSARNEFSGDDGTFLDANENPYGNNNRYPDPLQRVLKNKIAEVKSVYPTNIFVGNGSDEAIDLCFRIFCEPGKDKVAMFSPTYGMYQVCATINNVEIVSIELNEIFQIDVEKTFNILNNKDIKLLFICSPNNPTGNTLDGIELIIKNFEGMVVVDEAYIDFTNNSLLSKIRDYPNLIILQTLSKAWGLAAARVGLAFASDEIISIFNNVKPPYNISALNQKAAIKQLENKEQYESQKMLIIAERKKLSDALINLSFVKKVYPSQANFLLIEVTDADAIYENLVEQKIIVRNRNKAIANCLRISVGTQIENEKLLFALKNISL